MFSEKVAYFIIPSFSLVPFTDLFVIVITQAWVHCLVCLHDAWRSVVPEDDCRYIRQCTSAFVATNMLHFWHTKNLPELAIDCFACLYNIGWLLWLWHFNSNVCVLFINLTSFDDGIFLNVSEEMFHRFYQKVVAIMIEIMIKWINIVCNAFYIV